MHSTPSQLTSSAVLSYHFRGESRQGQNRSLLLWETVHHAATSKKSLLDPSKGERVDPGCVVLRFDLPSRGFPAKPSKRILKASTEFNSPKVHQRFSTILLLTNPRRLAEPPSLLTVAMQARTSRAALLCT